MEQRSGRTVAYIPFEEAFEEHLPDLLPLLEKHGFNPIRIEDPNHWADRIADPEALLAVFGSSYPEENAPRDESSEWWPAIVEDAFVSVAFQVARKQEIPIITVLISDTVFSPEDVRKRLGGPMRDVSWGAKNAVPESDIRLIRAEREDDLQTIVSRVLDELAGEAKAPAGRIASISGASVSDSVTSEDSLGFRVYYEAMAEFLTNPDTVGPLTISVEGEWGSGKSSFMEMLRRRLEEKGAGTVTFNAWRHDREDAMWAAFAMKFVEDLSARLGRFQRMKAAWNLMKRRFDWRSGWSDFARTILFTALWIAGAVTIWLWGAEIVADMGAPEEGSPDLPTLLWVLLGVGGTAGAARSLFLAARDATEIVGNPLRFDLRKHVKSEDYASRIGFIERFHNDFSRIVDAYAGDRKVFVFVDDLDRCEVPRAADLMQALNLMIGADRRLIFIIGMDRLKVAAGLAVKFKDILPYVDAGVDGSEQKARAGAQFGYEFIEKFIQLPFRVPAANEEGLDRFLRDIGRKRGAAPTTDRRGSGRRYFGGLRAGTSAVEGTRDGRESELSHSAGEEPDEASAPMPERQWDVLALQVREDSDAVRDVVKLVARALDYNPRRLKQFINLFRLRAYMAYNTGLLHPEVDAERSTALTLEQLGKFVAVGLRWPIFMMDLEADRTLLRRLSQYAEAAEHGTTYEPDEGDRETEVEKAWRRNRILLRLLTAKADPRVTPEDAERYRTYEDHTLTRLDVARLLRIAPAVAVPESDATAKEQREGQLVSSTPDSMADVPDSNIVNANITKAPPEVKGRADLA